MVKNKKTEKDFWVEMSIKEIWSQANFAEIAYRNINPKSAKGTDAVFSSIHSFLSHCANVSKLLKSNDDENPPRSIGDILGVLKASIIHNRRFRNNLEHYDKELKKWIRSRGINVNIGMYNIGPKQMISNMLFVSHYDPTDDTFTFVNEDFNLGRLNNEAIRIKCLADKWVKEVQFGIVNPPYI